MTHERLKKILHNFVKLYFADATVIWGQTKVVNTMAPQITLTMGKTQRAYISTRTTNNGVPTDFYPSKTILQIDLSTKGSEVMTETEDGVLTTRRNTAVSDLTEFVNFMNSDFGINWCDNHNITLISDRINDLTNVINDTSWDYRAMTEIEVHFTETAVGHSGIGFDDGRPFYCNGMPKFDDEGYKLDRDGNRISNTPMPIPDADPTPSGGRTQDLANSSTGWFEQVEIKEEE